MWTCPRCGTRLEDGENTCWRCTRPAFLSWPVVMLILLGTLMAGAGFIALITLRIRQNVPRPLPPIVTASEPATLLATPEAIAAHIRALDSSALATRAAAINALVRIGEPAIPSLIQALDEGKYFAAQAAGEALAKIGPPAVPGLVEVLEDPLSPVHLQIIRCLGTMRTNAVEALPALIMVARNETAPGVAKSAEIENALAQIAPDLSNYSLYDLVGGPPEGRPKDKNLFVLAVAKKGVLAKDAVPELIEVVKNERALTRGNAVFALGIMGANATNGVSAILEVSKDEDARVRKYAAFALGKITREKRPEVSATLLGMLRDTEPAVRQAAAEAFGNPALTTEESLAGLKESLQDTNGLVRAATARALGRHRGAEAAQLLAPALKDTRHEVRRSAAWGLQMQNVQAAIPALIAALQDKHGSVRRQAATALEGIGPEDPVDVAVLVAALQNTDYLVRYHLARALGKLNNDAKAAAVLAVIETLKRSPGEPDGLVMALGEMGAAAKPALPILIERFPKTLYFRPTVIRALGQIAIETGGSSIPPGDGESVSAVISLLREALRDRDASVRREAAAALGRANFSDQPTIAALAVALQDTDSLVRNAAANALGQPGVGAEARVSALRVALMESAGAARGQIAAALARIGPEARTATPDLMAILKADDPTARRFAAEALGQIGPSAKDAIPILKDLLNDTDAHVPHAAAEALGKIGVAAHVAAPALIELLRNADDHSRPYVSDALARLAAETNQAVAPALVSLLKDPDTRMGQAAIDIWRKAKLDAKIIRSNLVEISQSGPSFGRHLALQLLADLQVNEGQLADGIATYKQAIALAPENSAPLEKLGDLYRRQGNLAEASAAYDLSRAQMRNSVAQGTATFSVYNNLAWFYVQKEIKPAEALELAQKAADLAPTTAYVLDTLGWANLRNERYAEALDAFYRVVQIKMVEKPSLVSSWKGVFTIAQSSVESVTFLSFANKMAAQSSALNRLRMQAAMAAFHAHRGQTDQARAQWSQTGFISETNWLVLGPFVFSGADTAHLNETSVKIDLQAEYPGKTGVVRWQKSFDGMNDGLMDLGEIFGKPEWVAAYAWTTIHLPTERQAQLRIGSDDGVKVWLNGKLVHGVYQGRLAVLDQDIIPVTLKAGENTILLKTCNERADWEFFLRLTDASGQPFKDW